jgi:ribosomal protein L29
MSVFMFGKQKAKEQIINIDKEEFEKMLKDANKYLTTSSIQSEIQPLTTSREVKHLKQQIWKFSHK